MKVTFGIAVTQGDGSADDTDPATPPGSYNGPLPGGCADGPSFARSGPIRAVILPGLHTITADEGAVLGANPAGGSTPTAMSRNKVTESFTVTYSIWDSIKAAFGFKPAFSVQWNLDFTVTNAAGPGNVMAVAFLLGPAGGLATIQHSYDVTQNPANPAQVNIRRNDGTSTTIPNGGKFSEPAPAVSPAVGLDPGNYTFQSELNVWSKADGKVLVSAQISSALNY
jgi:hypothetical protein